ncbi:uncharacterized protein OCT59_001468 [Rhizophagus irregularis]|uniref:uncharacterized protein n=1 Tax=Rhizophagus irregularis TaxID=588596 RepID=UPI00332D9449|nr:hypothetical protein OCT59_001468 [Rhizophagus irregularis]
MHILTGSRKVQFHIKIGSYEKCFQNVKSYLLMSDDLIIYTRDSDEGRPMKTCGFFDYNTSKASTSQDKIYSISLSIITA